MTTIGVGVGMAGGSVAVGVGVVVGVAVAPSSFGVCSGVLRASVGVLVAVAVAVAPSSCGVCSGVLRAGVSVEVGVADGEDVSVPVAVVVGTPVGVGVSREEAPVGEAAISGVTVSVDGGARVSVEVVIGMLDAVASSSFGVCSGVLRAGVEPTASVGVSVRGTSVTAGRGASVGAAVGEGAPMSVAEGTGIGVGSVVSAEAGRLPAKNKKPPPSANKSASEAVREDRLSAQSGPRSCTDLSPGSARRVEQRVLQESGFVNGDPLDILSDCGRIAATTVAGWVRAVRAVVGNARSVADDGVARNGGRDVDGENGGRRRPTCATLWLG